MEVVVEVVVVVSWRSLIEVVVEEVEEVVVLNCLNFHLHMEDAEPAKIKIESNILMLKSTVD